MAQRRLGGGLIYAVSCVLLVVFAFGFNWAVGHRLVYALDQSMIFDGGWRIVQGQVPYKDFFIPFLPATFYIQAAFFKVFGVNWSSMVLPACMFSVLGALSALRTVRLLTGSRLLAVGTGFATAVSLQAPFGTLWLEQTALFFDLVALQAAVESIHAVSERRRALYLAACGILAAIAILGKQNFGILFSPILVLVIFAGNLENRKRAMLHSVIIAGSAAACIGGFLLWIMLASDLHEFVQHAIVVAGQIGRSRLTMENLMKALTFQVAPYWYQVDLIGIPAALAYIPLLWSRPVLRSKAPVVLCAFVLPFYRSFVQSITYNDYENTMAFTGMVVCLAIFLIVSLRQVESLYPRWIAKFAVAVLLVVAGWSAFWLRSEAMVAWRRRIHGREMLDGTVFAKRLAVDGMRGVVWGEPTPVNALTKIRQTDFEGMVRCLQDQHANFFVMGDATFLYGVLGVPSPQPLLYFLASHSYSKSEVPKLDRMIHEALLRNHVSVIVRERETYLPDVHDSFPTFPVTWRWFQEEFRPIGQFGIYEVWKRGPALP